MDGLLMGAAVFLLRKLVGEFDLGWEPSVMLAEVILGLFVGVELLVCCSMPQLDEVGL
jgi:hypothetical protein